MRVILTAFKTLRSDPMEHPNPPHPEVQIPIYANIGILQPGEVATELMPKSWVATFRRTGRTVNSPTTSEVLPEYELVNEDYALQDIRIRKLTEAIELLLDELDSVQSIEHKLYLARETLKAHGRIS